MFVIFDYINRRDQSKSHLYFLMPLGPVRLKIKGMGLNTIQCLKVRKRKTRCVELPTVGQGNILKSEKKS